MMKKSGIGRGPTYQISGLLVSLRKSRAEKVIFRQKKSKKIKQGKIDAEKIRLLG